MIKYLLLYFVLFTTSITLYSQTTVRGQVADAITNKKLGSATITNLALDLSRQSDSSGYFSINATYGDSLIIHMLSYTNDTIIVTKDKYLVLIDHEKATEVVSKVVSLDV